MYQINENEVLTKVTRHELLRENDRVFIDVHEIIAGKADQNFVAIPTNIVGMWPERQYWGNGNSLQIALAECLRNIHNIELSVIFPETILQEDTVENQA